MVIFIIICYKVWVNLVVRTGFEPVRWYPIFFIRFCHHLPPFRYVSVYHRQGTPLPFRHLTNILLNAHDKLESLNNLINAHACSEYIKLGNVSILMNYTKVNTISFCFGHFLQRA